MVSTTATASTAAAENVSVITTTSNRRDLVTEERRLAQEEVDNDELQQDVGGGGRLGRGAGVSGQHTAGATSSPRPTTHPQRESPDHPEDEVENGAEQETTGTVVDVGPTGSGALGRGAGVSGQQLGCQQHQNEYHDNLKEYYIVNDNISNTSTSTSSTTTPSIIGITAVVVGIVSLVLILILGVYKKHTKKTNNTNHAIPTSLSATLNSSLNSASYSDAALPQTNISKIATSAYHERFNDEV